MKFKNWMLYTLRDVAGEGGDAGGGSAVTDSSGSSEAAVSSDAGDTGPSLSKEDLESAVSSIGEGLGFVKEPTEEELAIANADKEAEAAAKTAEESTKAAKALEDAAKATASGKPAPLTDINVPPASWRDAAKAEWAKLPEAARQEILKRENDMFDGIAQYKDNAVIGKSVLQTLQPYLPLMEQYKVNPVQHIDNLMRTHQTLLTSTAEDRTKYLMHISKQYGVDLVPRGASSEASDDSGTYVDPTVEKLTSELHQVKSALAQISQAAQKQQVSTLEQSINEFASKPEHPHFNLVAKDMGLLISKGIASNLKEAYDKAIRLNPEVWALETQRLQTEAAEKAKKEALAKAEQVKRSTAANVTSKVRDGSRTTPLGTMEDTMKETAAKFFK